MPRAEQAFRRGLLGDLACIIAGSSLFSAPDQDLLDRALRLIDAVDCALRSNDRDSGCAGGG